jgi:hypothetical protein
MVLNAVVTGCAVSTDRGSEELTRAAEPGADPFLDLGAVRTHVDAAGQGGLGA